MCGIPLVCEQHVCSSGRNIVCGIPLVFTEYACSSGRKSSVAFHWCSHSMHIRLDTIPCGIRFVLPSSSRVFSSCDIFYNIFDERVVVENLGATGIPRRTAVAPFAMPVSGKSPS